MSARPASLLNLRQGLGLQSSMSGGFQQGISTTSPKASGTGGLRRLARWDVDVGTHVHLTVCTQVLEPIPSLPDAVARPGIHA
jgi:hypothetical protein